MILKYSSGEEVKRGDRVLFHGDRGQVEFVAIDKDDPEMAWYVEEYGGGIMIADKVAGHTFVPADQVGEYERLGDLEFLSRGDLSDLTIDESDR